MPAGSNSTSAPLGVVDREVVEVAAAARDRAVRDPRGAVRVRVALLPQPVPVHRDAAARGDVGPRLGDAVDDEHLEAVALGDLDGRLEEAVDEHDGAAAGAVGVARADGDVERVARDAFVFWSGFVVVL